MAVVFFSYSHADEALRDRLAKGLAMLVRQELIESFHDRRIPPGDHVDTAISAELERADIILLLLSPDFLASDYCYGIEMGRAMERQASGEARVVPVILRPCDWQHTPMRALMALPTDGKPITRFPDLDEAFLNVSQGIRQALGHPSPAPSLRSKPPVGKDSPAIEGRQGPRSSNLHLKKTFTDIDRDRFRDEAFEFLAKYFENSVAELQQRNPGVEGRFKRIDAHQFTAQLYRDGKKLASCRIHVGSGYMDRGILYSANETAAQGGYNESMDVHADDEGLSLKASGMASYGREERRLTFEGGAELYWSMLIEAFRR